MLSRKDILAAATCDWGRGPGMSVPRDRLPQSYYDGFNRTWQRESLRIKEQQKGAALSLCHALNAVAAKKSAEEAAIIARPYPPVPAMRAAKKSKPATMKAER